MYCLLYTNHNQYMHLLDPRQIPEDGNGIVLTFLQKGKVFNNTPHLKKTTCRYQLHQIVGKNVGVEAALPTNPKKIHIIECTIKSCIELYQVPNMGVISVK